MHAEARRLEVAEDLLGQSTEAAEAALDEEEAAGEPNP